MKKICVIPAIIVCAVLNLLAANEVITNFKDPSIVCDYLIVGYSAFVGPATMLAQHRNSFAFDDVQNAKFASMEVILAEFPGTDNNHRNVALWKALKWAREHWQSPFKYLVLVGTDWFTINPADSLVYSNGWMPTWSIPIKAEDPLNPKPGYYITDDYYTWLSDSVPPTPGSLSGGNSGISIGRIPALTDAICSLYVEKVIQFDLAGPRGPWRNNVLAIADDVMQGYKMDQLYTQHMEAADLIADSLMKDRLVSKRYNISYPYDAFMEKPLAKAAIIKTINSGVMWAFFFGHGNNQVLTDECVLTTDDYDKFTNDSTPFVFTAFTSLNASFFGGLNNASQAMCMRYLFKDRGGAIAYFGCATEAYASDNEKLGRNIYENLRSKPDENIGTIFASAKAACRDENSLSYFLLGDPALRVSPGNTPVTVKQFPDSAPTSLKISVPNGLWLMHYSVSFTYRNSVSYPDPTGLKGEIGFSFDSVLSTRSGDFQQTVDVPIPVSATPRQKAIVYVWNDTMDGRAEVTLTPGASNAVLSMQGKKAIAGPPALSNNRGILVVSNLTPQPYQVRMFDIRGKIVWSGVLRPNDGAATISLLDKNISPGRYVLQVKNEAGGFAFPFLHMGRN